MSSITIKESLNLKGEINILGSKNSALPIIIASLLVNGKITLQNIPYIEDIINILEIFDELKIKYKFNNNTLIIFSKEINYNKTFEKNIKKLRASYYFMGVFLARYKYINILYPGGCNIGSRPIDLHLFGFKKLNADLNLSNNTIEISGKNMIPNLIALEKKSVGATINILLSSTYLQGVTIIENPATEPEVDDIINFLNVLGFKCFRLNNYIIIEGKKDIIKNIDIVYKFIPDRIETLTYICFGLKNFSELTLNNVNINHILKPLKLLTDANANIEIINNNKIKIHSSFLKNFNFETNSYPDIPTDIMPILGILQLLSDNNKSTLKENIFENRLNSFHELTKIGAKISFISNNEIIITGIKKFDKGIVYAYDLRGAASLIFAGLNSESLKIENYEYINRGYDSLIDNLIKCNANIIYNN